MVLFGCRLYGIRRTRRSEPRVFWLIGVSICYVQPGLWLVNSTTEIVEDILAAGPGCVTPETNSVSGNTFIDQVDLFDLGGAEGVVVEEAGRDRTASNATLINCESAG